VQHFCYADDTLILLTADSSEEAIAKLKNIIREIEMEMKKRGLILNRKKTAIMMITKIRKYTGVNSRSIRIGEDTLFFSKAIKYLGIWIDEKLKWNTHLKEVERKCYQMLAQMNAVMKNVHGYATNHRRIMLNGTIGAYLKYGSVVFTNTLPNYA